MEMHHFYAIAEYSSYQPNGDNKNASTFCFSQIPFLFINIYRFFFFLNDFIQLSIQSSQAQENIMYEVVVNKKK